MCCPHGNSTPATCSQCIGFPARKVTRDEDTGQLFVGGEPAPRQGLLQATGAVALKRNGRIRTCRFCTVPGHESKDCRKNPASKKQRHDKGTDYGQR